MSLKLTLKPGEQFFVGTSVITVMSKTVCQVEIAGNAPVLRAENGIKKEQIRDNITRMQFILQSMYLSGDVKSYHAEYFGLVQRMLLENPAHTEWLLETNCLMIEGDLYKALRSTQKMAGPAVTDMGMGMAEFEEQDGIEQLAH